MTLRAGQKVRVSYEATYYVQQGDGSHSVEIVRSARAGEFLATVPADATIEPIEDLRPGDVVIDANKCVYERTVNHEWIEPGSADRLPDALICRPLTLLVRDGKPVQP